MAERHTSSIEVLARQPESLQAVVSAIRRERQLRPLLTRLVQQAYDATKRHAARIAIINRIGRLITSRLSLDEILQTAIEAICENLHFADLGLMLVDPDNPELLMLRAKTGVYSAIMPTDYRQSIHQGIVGAVARMRRRILLNDVTSDPRYIPTPGVDDVCAELAVPVVVGDRLLGVLNVESTRPLSEEDGVDLEIVADQLGAAIDNAQLFAAEKRRAARIAIINRIGQLITSSLSLDQILQTAVEAIDEHLHYPIVAVLLVDADEPSTLVLRACTNVYLPPEIGRYRQSVQHGIIGAAARARKPLLLADVASDPRYLTPPGARNICAEVAVPIIVGNRLLGVLNVESEQRITEEEAGGLQIIADQLGVAIDNAHLFARTQQTLAETQLLYETSRRMSTAMDVDEVIDAYLEQVAARGRYVCTVMLYTFDEVGQRTAAIIRGRWTPQEGLVHLEERLPYTRDAFDALLDAAQTVTIADFRTDPRVSEELRRLQTRNKRPAWAMIPLMVRGQRIGLVILSYPFVHRWSEADLQPYQATAAQLAAAIDSRRQHLLLIERGQQLAVLEERQRLARELHDSVTQLIFSMTLIAQSIAPAWQRHPAEGERRVKRLLELSQSTLAEMRALLAELRPAADAETTSAEGAIAGIERVRRDGLAAALRLHIAEIACEGFSIDLDTTNYGGQPLAQEEALYRIVQEALNNVVKHAHARHVQITLGRVDGSTHLTVQDDGRGFTLELAGIANRVAAHREGGFGLRSMRERAEALQGQIDIISAPGKGTIVDVRLPQKDA